MWLVALMISTLSVRLRPLKLVYVACSRYYLPGESGTYPELRLNVIILSCIVEIELHPETFFFQLYCV